MKRKLLLIPLALLLAISLVATGCPAPAPPPVVPPVAPPTAPAPAPEQVIKWKAQSAAPSTNYNFPALERTCKIVEEMTNGRLIITAYSAGAITGGAGIFDGVAERVTEMAEGWPNWWLGKNPGFSFVMTGPFEFMNCESAFLYFYEGGGTEIANEFANPFGITWRLAWVETIQTGIWCNFPVTGLDSLKGKKVRMGPGLPCEVLIEAAGCYAEPTVAAEIYPALERGLLDAVEWTTPCLDYPMHFQDVTTHILTPGVWQPCGIADFLINTEAYSELPNDIKAILEQAIQAHASRVTWEIYYLDMMYLEKLKEEGMIFVKFSDEDMAKWLAAAEKVYAKHYAEDPAFRKVYDSKMKFKEEYYSHKDVLGPYKYGDTVPYRP